MYISTEYALRFGLNCTPNYNEIIKSLQKMWLAKRRLKRLKFLSYLQQHIDEFRFRPGNAGYNEISNKNKTLFIF